MTTLRPVQRPPSLHRTVQDAIKDFILSSTLQPGDALPSENELSRQLGVSRNSVREAIKSLESIGVLETRRGSGLFLRQFSFEPLFEGLEYGLVLDLQDLAELLELRRVLETGFIGQAIARCDRRQLDTLHSLVEQMRVCAEQGQAFPEEDRAFHRCLFERLENRTLLRLIDTFWLGFTKAVRNTPGLTNRTPLSTYQDHLAIVLAIAARNEVAAQKALEKHYADIQTNLDRMLGRTPRHQTKGNENKMPSKRRRKS